PLQPHLAVIEPIEQGVVDRNERLPLAVVHVHHVVRATGVETAFGEIRLALLEGRSELDFIANPQKDRAGEVVKLLHKMTVKGGEVEPGFDLDRGHAGAPVVAAYRDTKDNGMLDAREGADRL